jgi:hypothetical protein
MTILNKIHSGLQSVYDVTGATALRSIATAIKIGAGIYMQDQTMISAGLVQTFLAYSTSVFSTSTNITAAAIIAESAVINGASYLNTTTQGFMNTVYTLGGKLEISTQDKWYSLKTATKTNPLKAFSLFVLDAAVEGLIFIGQQNNDPFDITPSASELDITPSASELDITPSEL